MEKPTTTDHNPDRSSMCLCCWKHPRYHLVAKSMDHFTRKKILGRNWHPPKFENSKNMWHPGIPNNWKSRMPNLCRISISDFWAEESFKWVAASPGRYPMAGSQKNSQSKKTIQRKSSKNMWFVQVFGFTFSLSWWQALNKETTKNVAVFHTTIASFSWSLFRGTREECGKKWCPSMTPWRELTISFRIEHASPVENLGWIHQLIWAQGLCWQKRVEPPKHAPNHFWHFWVFVSNWDAIFLSMICDWKTSINMVVPGVEKMPGNFPDFQVVGVFFAAIWRLLCCPFLQFRSTKAFVF